MVNEAKIITNLQGAKTLTLAGREISLPGGIKKAVRIRDRLVVQLHDYERSWKDSLSENQVVRKKALESLARESSWIWCFDLNGNLIWKIPEAVPTDLTAKRPVVTYYVDFDYLPDLDGIMAVSARGYQVCVRLEDGVLISREEGR